MVNERVLMSNWWTNEGCFIIAEAGLNHNGDVLEAKRLIEVAVESGADCVKFQKRDVSSLATESQLNRMDSRFPSLGSTYREIRQKLEFTMSEYRELMDHCDNLGILFMVTPFDVRSLEDLELLGVENYKVASHGITNYPLLNKLAETGKPVVMSSGMSTMEELEVAAGILSSGKGVLAAILHCISSYPTPNDEINLNLIPELKRKFGKRVGYSGHELGMLPTFAAVAIGASVVERHFTRDCSQEGFDHHMSLDPAGLSTMVDSIRQIEAMQGDGKKKVLDSEMVARDKYRLSMVATADIQAGETLSRQMFEFRNPGTGIPPQNANEFVGRRLGKGVEKGELVLEGYFE
tara:strand:- start:7912 stop:8958 length:1047 start_codon:yes stop_codon:yes gene_type:complete